MSKQIIKLCEKSHALWSAKGDHPVTHNQSGCCTQTTLVILTSLYGWLGNGTSVFIRYWPRQHCVNLSFNTWTETRCLEENTLMLARSWRLWHDILKKCQQRRSPPDWTGTCPPCTGSFARKRTCPSLPCRRNIQGLPGNKSTCRRTGFGDMFSVICLKWPNNSSWRSMGGLTLPSRRSRKCVTRSWDCRHNQLIKSLFSQRKW
jgi:hypothetical protein